jgi:O-acetyl-ADP-ribose deacetylase (regulator of RNase III)
MQDSLKVNRSTIRLAKGDITDLEIESFVYYANHDLSLGSGFGNAISMRGGPSIQKELKEHGPLATTEVLVSKAGDMKATYIIHAVGPRFQEEDLEKKLRDTILNALGEADSKGIKNIAFPPMGSGFYGVPLTLSAEIMFETILEYLSGDTHIEEIVICLLDNREYKPFQEQLAGVRQS